MRTIVYREEAEQYADAHEYHDEIKRDGCPLCEDRPLRSYPSYAALLRVRYREQDISVSTDTAVTKSGHNKATGKWAVYVKGRKLHGGLSSSDEARQVRQWYLDGLDPESKMWEFVGGKQPSPSSTDIQRASR